MSPTNISTLSPTMAALLWVAGLMPMNRSLLNEKIFDYAFSTRQRVYFI
jgi:hypothetical protein